MPGLRRYKSRHTTNTGSTRRRAPESRQRSPRPACSVDGSSFLTRFAQALAPAVVPYPLSPPSRTTSQLRFSTRTQVCFPPPPVFYPGLRFSARVAPHIGHLYTLVTADIFARYNRLANPTRPVQFVTGTDEHGLKIQRAAHGASRDPQVFCDRLSAEFRVRRFTWTPFQRDSRPVG